jgi:hypothetical protein
VKGRLPSARVVTVISAALDIGPLSLNAVTRNVYVVAGFSRCIFTSWNVVLTLRSLQYLDTFYIAENKFKFESRFSISLTIPQDCCALTSTDCKIYIITALFFKHIFKSSSCREDLHINVRLNLNSRVNNCILRLRGVQNEPFSSFNTRVKLIRYKTETRLVFIHN